MANVEEDQAGRLRAFRRRFGRAFDSSFDDDNNNDDDDAMGSARQAAADADVSQAERKARADIATATSGMDDGAAPSTTPSTGTPPESAASKTQTEASLHGQGLGTTSSSGWNMDSSDEDANQKANETESRKAQEDDQDNLIDLISSYSGGEAEQLPGGAGARVVTRGTTGVAGDAGKGKKKKGGKKR